MENVVVHPLVLLSVVDHFNRSVNLIFVFSLYNGGRLNFQNRYVAAKLS